MLTGLCDQYPEVLRKNRELFVAVVLAFIFVCALPTTTCGGFYLVRSIPLYCIRSLIRKEQRRVTEEFMLRP